jgi:ribosomal protein S18 acetylase RimI-like enzyme
MPELIVGTLFRMDDFTVRPATPAQTRALRREVLRPHETLEELAARERSDGLSLGGFRGEQLIATGTILRDPMPGGDPTADEWRIRGMATAPQARGQGAGSAVLAALIAHAHGEGAERVWCNARSPALNLYRRAGFTVISDEFELPEIGPHFRLCLPLSGTAT